MTSPIRLEVTAEEGGLRLDLLLATRFPDRSRSYLQKLIRDGHVSIGAQAAKAARTLTAGDTVEIVFPEPVASRVEAEPIPLAILYEDPWIIVVDKPSGLVVHPGAGVTSGTLVNALLHHCTDLSGIGGVERPGIVHRLDKETSGVMVVAKTDAAHRHLSRQFESRTVSKRYLALVWGEMKDDTGSIDVPIGRDTRHRVKISARTSRPREAVTRYRVLKRLTGGPGDATLSWIEVMPLTGRTHQIRVHLQMVGHSVAGDATYGGIGWQRISDTGRREVLRSLGRLALHASRLEIVHPGDGRRVAFEAPVPAPLASCVERLAEMVGR